MKHAFILAHVGHWYISILYLAPLLAIVLLLSIASWRDRRAGERSHETDGGDKH